MPKNSDDKSTILAAVDLGSNSFHLLIAKIDNGEMRPILSKRERVQLAAGLQQGLLNDDAFARGLHCLTQFRQLLNSVEPDHIRVVGTNTLRAAKNAPDFIKQGSEALGHPIQTISGREEARLVYLGVAHTLADDQQARLVIDIGGGSTEFIIGQQFECKLLESLHMGCITYRDKFFPDGEISVSGFEKAYRKAYQELLNIREIFRANGWDEVVGSSGSFNAIARVVNTDGNSELITRDGLEELKEKICSFNSIEELKIFENLRADRRSTLPSGLAICIAIFDALEIKRMRTSNGALREGVVYELIGRFTHEDVRERTITAMMTRYQVNPETASRVEAFARQLFAQSQKTWCLKKPDSELLSWAARLHEIGLSIAHSKFHRHGQYLIEHSDLAGFSFTEQRALALLVRSHRRKFPLALFDDEYSGKAKQRLLRLSVLLRLAVLFKYVAPIEGTPDIKVTVDGPSCTLSFQKNWLKNHPLTFAELEDEQRYLKSAGFKLTIK
ncbi:MAG: Ppx/GppA phosphatase family protein [Pseudomonadales bacterium]|nr:Ppx/GppA phosphatase family protein [Pseudomonadales bacterium]